MGDCVHTFLWKIKPFSQLLSVPKNIFYESPSFSINISDYEFKDEHFWLRFYPSEQKLKSTSYMVCFIRCNSDFFLEKIRSNIKLAILNKKGYVVCEKDSTCAKSIFEGYWGWSEFISIEDLRSKMRNWREDALTFRCEISCENNRKGSVSKAMTYFWTINNPLNLCLAEMKIYDHYFIPFLPSKIVLSKNLNDYEMTLFAHEMSPEKIEMHVRVLVGNYLSTVKTIRNCEFNQSKKYRLLLNGIKFLQKLHGVSQVTIKCDFLFQKELPSIALNIKTPAHLKAEENIDVLENALSDFVRMFTDQIQCDVMIRVGGKAISAHKFVLIARSPVFATMFDQNMLESNSGVVDIPDCKWDVYYEFLKFLYSGDLEEKDFDYEKILQLLLTAHKYQVRSLETKCSAIFKSYMSVANVCEILSIFDMINDADCKTSAIDFLLDNTEEVLDSPEWSEWVSANAVLAAEILHKIS